ncbi:MAG: ATP-binding cassette domain-containing protein [Clostridiaceae bacterium]|nr:ATP-binding cassette domain-containing protein [Clostridiaceae bacterium]
MSMLQLVNITKTYRIGEQRIPALRQVSIAFRKNEFVSVLGPSGCGKTTLLNVVGGLDRYDDGDLVINGQSTKAWNDSDWDAYRNRSVGFVFQNYNLIAHQSVLQNVEISLTLAGVAPAERRRRAHRALESVGLSDQVRKKPNQLSGGQMQRVAIARALVNDPDILLADEPTGALDSHTSEQVLEILKEVSRTRLVLMVTHNAELAERYSDRIVRLLDGEVVSDTRSIGSAEDSTSSGKASEPATGVLAQRAQKRAKTSMSLSAAAGLSFRNLMTKRGRTILTSIAGSIGIAGVALVLALSGGLGAYMDDLQTEALSGFPISVNPAVQNVDLRERGPLGGGRGDTDGYVEYPEGDAVYRYDSAQNRTTHTNRITDEYLEYVGQMEASLGGVASTIAYTRGVDFNLLARAEDTVLRFDVGRTTPMESLQGTGNTYWQEMPDNPDFVLSLYELVGENSRLPETEGEIAIVVDKYNRMDEALFRKLGMMEPADTYTVHTLLGTTPLKAIPNDAFYVERDGAFLPVSTAEYDALFASDTGTPLTVTGVLRIREDAASEYFSPGIIYTTALSERVALDAENSAIAAAQLDSPVDVLTGAPFADDRVRDARLLALGAVNRPVGIQIYPADFDSKDAIKEYLDAYNDDKDTADQVLYTDLSEMVTDMISSLLDTVTTVLVGFAAISLVVSTIMIGIITYVSVIERTREIGVLRSVGARKRDITRLFDAETLIIGLAAGVLGIASSFLLSIPIDAIVARMSGIEGIVRMTPYMSVLLVAGSMLLTVIAGTIPARMAARMDPVAALRSE